MVCVSVVWRSHPPGRSSGGNRICSFRERLIARLRAACVEEWLWKLKEPDDQVILPPTTVLISMFYFVVVQAQSPMQALADVFNTRVTLSLKARIEDWKYREWSSVLNVLHKPPNSQANPAALQTSFH